MPSNKRAPKLDSKPVRDLNALIAALSDAAPPARDPSGGCFCLAREHPLSPHTPSCPSCALPLCTLNPPHHLCPSCAQPLLTPAQSASLLASLQLELSNTLEHEERERQRRIDDAKRAEGAFPSLTPTNPSGRNSPAPPLPQLRPAHETGHKILSLSSSGKSGSSSGKQKIKLVTISRTPTPASSRPSTPAAAANTEATVIRVPPPPTHIEHVPRRKPDPDRPWRNFLLDAEGRGVKYVPPSIVQPPSGSNIS